jgi:hypothetical protein
LIFWHVQIWGQNTPGHCVERDEGGRCSFCFFRVIGLWSLLFFNLFFGPMWRKNFSSKCVDCKINMSFGFVIIITILLLERIKHWKFIKYRVFP